MPNAATKSKRPAKQPKHTPKPTTKQPPKPPAALPTLYVFTKDAVRDLDRRAMADFGLSSLVLMENAARHAADVALDLLESIDSPRVLIVTGKGNNAGDGFALSRHLSNAGVAVHIAMLEPVKALSGDAATNARIAHAMGIASTLLPSSVAPTLRRHASRADLIIDAILGTGLERPLEGRYFAAIQTINNARTIEHRPVVLALDIPSGMNADTGQPQGDAIRADVTITFAGLKQGFLNDASWEFLGDVIVGDIGAPTSLLRDLGTKLSLEARYHRPKRDRVRG